MATESSDLAQAIVEWSLDRPKWQQRALRLLARGEPIDTQELQMLADTACLEAGGNDVKVTTLTPAEIPGGSGEEATVRLASITNPQSINAISWEEGITFESSGITIVYGENGSGKSGYARILKKVTRSRHSADVLTDVFKEPTEQSALLTISRGDRETKLVWPSDQPDYLARVSFYDSDCATRYISTDTEVAYRPSAISLFDDLAGIASNLRTVLEDRRPTPETLLVDFSTLVPESIPDRLVRSLSADTSALEIDLASELPLGYESNLSSLEQRIRNFQANDTGKKFVDLTELRESITQVCAHISSGWDVFSDDSVSSIAETTAFCRAARDAADAVSSKQFASEPITGVGTPAWLALWEAARRYSEEVAYPGLSFPVVSKDGDSAQCVLCHQGLAPDAADRLRAFQEFVAADAERSVRETSVTLDRLATPLRDYEAFTTAVQLALQRIERESEEASSEIRDELQALQNRRLQVITSMDDGAVNIEPLPPRTEFVATKSLIDRCDRQIEDLTVDNPELQLKELLKEKGEILSRLAIRDHRIELEAHISYLGRVRLINEAIRLTSTTGITRRAADLTRSHVSDVLRDHFRQETVGLGLDQVRLADAGGGYGKLRHRTELIGAKQSAPLEDVLSEGEQSALGLAGFLTEVETDSTRSAVVFDDPLTSLDHVRRENVVTRIVRLAAKRQVVIFTHDIAFVVDLKRAADRASVEIAERWVSRNQLHVGQVTEGGPWDGKIVRQRIDEMSNRLAQVRDAYDANDPTASHEAVRSWYQDLRLVWERALEEVVIGPVNVRGRLEFRPSNLKVFVRFNEDDDQEFQTAFTRCGDRGSHDRSSELNRPLPPLTELEEDLETLRAWHARIRRY